MAIDKVNLADKLSQFTNHWDPTAATLNTGNVRSARTVKEPERI